MEIYKTYIMKHSEKPTHAKPALYAQYYFQLKEIAESFGYNLLLHGSVNRDLDLVAVPWIDNPKDEFEMIKAMSLHLKGVEPVDKDRDSQYSVLPGGRGSYVINLNRGGAWNDYVDNQYYIDISVTPKPVNHEPR